MRKLIERLGKVGLDIRVDDGAWKRRSFPKTRLDSGPMPRS